jgi:serine/threonine protein kinase
MVSNHHALALAPRMSSPTADAIGHRVPDGMRLGPYQITGFIGAGAMGEVYRAHDSNLDRVVALKLLPADLATDQELLARFEEEARLASSLNHPAIVTIYGAGQIGSQPYISMELVAGETLREMLARGPLPFRRAIRIAAQIAEGLAKAHDAGLVHRDLKPENIRVSFDGFAKILDFGLAKRLTPFIGSCADTHTAVQTVPGSVVGTAGYMAPEQASGGRADARSDQFAFGAVLYEMLTGQRAFDRPTFAETLSAVIRDEPISLAQLNGAVPPPVRWIVDRCLAKDPAQRYAVTREVARDLASVWDHLPELLAPRRGRVQARPDAKRSIAVLPLMNLSSGDGPVALAEALTDALITELTAVTHLRVISRVSSMCFRDPRESLPEIASKLGADWILLGSVAVVGKKARVTAQLVDASSDENRWSHSYTRAPRNLLGLVEQVATAVSRDVQRLTARSPSLSRAK